MLLEQMRAKWEAAGRGAADERAPLLANWYLGYRHAWWEAMEMVRAAEPERSGHYECLSDKPSGTWAEAFKPEPARPAVTREAVATALLSEAASSCRRVNGWCGSGEPCQCNLQIDAIMALIGGEA